MRTEDKVAFLRDPASYPGRVRRVEVIETHFAWVFLTERHAYKMKKPIRQDVMDHRSLEARERGCRDEVRLNRRLAPRVYLGVVPLVRRNGRLALGGKGDITDWLVKMRRLPRHGMLDHILQERSLTDSELRRLCRRLARFFAEAQPEPWQPDAYVSRVQRQISRNRRELKRAGRRIRARLVEGVIRKQREFIVRARALLAARGPRVVDGHGDLKAEHVFMGPPVSVIDCVEFDRNLRLLDPIEELAFLALEIERLGHEPLVHALMRTFREAGGGGVSDALLSFYMSHRAATRAKLAVWHLWDPQFADARPWTERANSYLADADRYVRRALASLGEPGTRGPRARRDTRPELAGAVGTYRR